MRNIASALAIAALCQPALAQTISGPPGGGSSGNAINITSAPYNASVSATDNASGIQAAINAAIANKQALQIPAPPGGGCYKYTAPLTVAGNLTIIGDWMARNWPGTNQINVPAGSPPILGAVLCPTSNGSPAFQFSGTAWEIDIWNLGIQFQTPFAGTGDGFNYVNGDQSQGLTGGTWHNVSVYGHDGNHYAFNFQNSIYFTGYDLTSIGGGIANLAGNTAASLNYGNTTLIQPVGQVVVGGSANGFTLTASALQRNNLITLVRPQAIVNNVSGVSPGGNLPTSAQRIFSQDANTTAVTLLSPDFETNVGSGLLLGPPARNNSYDFNGMFTSAANINAPSWTTNGLMYGPQTRTVNDTTGTGTIPVQGLFSLPGYTQTATSAVTYTNLATLYVGAPTGGTNATVTRAIAIYANSGIFATGSLTSSGLFNTGTAQVNTNAGANTTAICNGTTTGSCTIGGSNTLNLAATTLQSGGTAAVTCAANSVTLATLVVTNGIVTHC